MKADSRGARRSGFSGLLLILSLSLLIVTGCARKPWTTTVRDEDSARIAQTFEEMQQRDASCFCCLDAKAGLFWDGPGEERSLAGFFQLMLPSSLKFVVLNPLGQPLYAMVSDGEEFQSVNTTLRQHVCGKLTALMAEYHIPRALFSADWGYWLIGRLHEPRATIETIRQDDAGRGVWITVSNPEEDVQAKSHLLIQPDTKRLLSRVLVDQQGETIATFFYEHGPEASDCTPPTRIIVTDLPYDAALNIDLTEMLTDRVFPASNFRLKVPANYDELVIREGEQEDED